MSDARFDKLDKTLEKIDDKVNKIDKHVVRLDAHVEKNTEDLAEHMRRTELNEDRIYRLEKIEQWLRGATWITLGLGSLLLALHKLLN
jgi:ribosome-binding ATPase YchF (GTP1/OBG family)